MWKIYLLVWPHICLMYLSKNTSQISSQTRADLHKPAMQLPRLSDSSSQSSALGFLFCHLPVIPQQNPDAQSWWCGWRLVCHVTRERATSAGCQWYPRCSQFKPLSALLTLRMQIFPRWFNCYLPWYLFLFQFVCWILFVFRSQVCLLVEICASHLTADHWVHTAQVSTQYGD